MRKIIGLSAIALALAASPGAGAMAATDGANSSRDYPAAQCGKPQKESVGRPQVAAGPSGKLELDRTIRETGGGDVQNVIVHNQQVRTYNQAAQNYNSCMARYLDAANGEITRLHDEAAAQLKQTEDDANARIQSIEKQVQRLVAEANGAGAVSATSQASSSQYPAPDCRKPDKLKPGRRTIAQTAEYDSQERAYKPCVAAYIAGATDVIWQIKNTTNQSTGQIAKSANDRIELIKDRIRDAAETDRVASAAPSGGQDLPAGAALESVTVIATKASTQAIDSFILSHATATRMTGKMARWKQGICPLTTGLDPKSTASVTQRIRDVASSIGAPVDKALACNANIEIDFTATPQALLDTIRKEHPGYLGYADNRQQSARLATFTHPIQSWYVTATADLRGHLEVDDPRPAGVTLDMPAPPGVGPGGMDSLSQGTIHMDLPGASIKNVTGNRLGDGLSSEFAHITIVAEPARLTDFETGTLADYIAMLALSQPGPMDGCEALPSITNLLSPGCKSIARTITDGDLAYLRGLYKMTPAGSLQMQRGEVRYQMEQTLKPGAN